MGLRRLQLVGSRVAPLRSEMIVADLECLHDMEQTILSMSGNELFFISLETSLEIVIL